MSALNIGYARRADRARVAYATIGSGPHLIMPAGRLSHIESWSEDARSLAFLERLASQRTVVLYDRHGVGLSDRNRDDPTFEDDLRDLEALTSALHIEQAAFFGLSWGGLATIGYTLRHPEHVTRIVLYGTFAGLAGSDEQLLGRQHALEELRRADYELYSKTLARLFFPSGADLETLEAFSRTVVQASSMEEADRLDRNDVFPDFWSQLSKIRQPALVIHRRGDHVVPFVAGQQLAMRLGNARFVPLDGDMHLPSYGDVDSVLRPTLEFLAEDGPSAERVAPTHAGTAIILFTDIVDSTALTERMGDAAFRAASSALDARLRDAIRGAGGMAVEGKLLGDGVLAVFTSAREAIAAAVGCRDAGEAAGLPLHVGVHAGDVIREEDNVYGGAVNIASRIAGASAPGEILVSDTVRSLARTSAGVAFEDRGEHEMKGIADPVRVYAVRAETA